MHLFGLTGGIASGKSCVSSILEELGCPIIDADIIARQVVEPGKPALKLVVHHFGDGVLQANGCLDRKKLAGIIFEDETKRQVLNRCTHPYIQKAMIWEALKYFLKGESFVILVSPLLFESNKYGRWIKKTIVVNCSAEQQVERLRRRDCLSEEEALQRIRAQMPLEEKCRKADLVVNNSGDMAALREEALKLCAELNKISMNQKMFRAYCLFLCTVALMYLLITNLFYL